MAFQHGKEGSFKLDDTGGAVIDLSAFLDNVNMSGQRELADVTTFGDDDREFIEGLRSASFDFSGVFETANTGANAKVIALYNASSNTNQDFEYGPAGTTSGYPKFTGKCIVTGWQISTNISDKVTFSFTCQVNGAVTAGTF